MTRPPERTRITLYMAMTVNGYIAKETDETPWSEGIWESYYRIARDWQAIILGRRTYQIMREAKEFPKIGSPFTVVISRKLHPRIPKTVFVKSPELAVRLLEEQGHDRALLAGGSRVNAAFLREGFIDEVILDIEPKLFGKGIPLFAKGEFEAALALQEARKISPEIVQLRYRVVR